MKPERGESSTVSKSGCRCRSRIRCGAAWRSSACSMPAVNSAAARANQPSAFQRFVLPGLAFKAVVIGGGYATGREIAEFFLPAGPWGGLAAMAVATAVWCVVCAVTFVFARRLRERDYRSFFRALLGRAWPLFEIAYLLFVVLILAVFGAAAGAIASATLGVPPIVGTL